MKSAASASATDQPHDQSEYGNLFCGIWRNDTPIVSALLGHAQAAAADFFSCRFLGSTIVVEKSASRMPMSVKQRAEREDRHDQR